MIKTNNPEIAGTKYVSATDCGWAVGAAVASGASCTYMAVPALEGQ
jgi:hypothetical protein